MASLIEGGTTNVQQALQIHIYKTAGTSVRNALPELRELPVHLTASQLRDHVGVKRWNAAFRFTFVRNPWDRMVSLYFYRLTHRRASHREQHRRRAPTFDGWITKLLTEDHGPDDPVFSTRYRRRYEEWIDVDQAEIDFVGRFENLKDDWDLICRKLGRGESLGHSHQTKHRHYSSYFTPATRDLCGEFFESDVKRYGYDF